MIQKILFTLIALMLLFVDINIIAIPYLFFSVALFLFFIYQKKINELILAFAIFGYSYTLFINKLTGIVNLGLILAIVSCFFALQIILGAQLIKKSFNATIVLYLLFFLTIVFSFFGIYTQSYQLFKFQLLILWFLIYFVSLISLDENVLKFDFESFLIISTFLFIPHFSNAEYEGATLSPLNVWDTFSVLDDGIRGHNFDIITATRIAGIGLLAFLVYILDFSFKKIYLILFVMFFGIMIVICQTRQSIIALFLPILVLILYNFSKERRNYFGIAIGLLFVTFSINSYLNYSESNGVESRIVSSVDGSSEEGTGREMIWEQAMLYINQEGSTTGFGNFTTFTRSATYPHNIFLEVYIEMGAFSLLILVAIVVLIIVELFKVFFVYENNTKLELFLILGTLYYFGLAQFSVDLPRNISFLFTFILFIFIKRFNSYNLKHIKA